MNTRKGWTLLPVAAVIAVIATLVGTAAHADDGDLSRHEFTSNEMGTRFRIVLYAKDAESAKQASNAAFARVKELNAMLSDYEAESELNKLTANGPTAKGIKVSPELWSLLYRSQKLAEQTDGAFDVTIGPYSRLWRRARRQTELPSAERMAEAKAVVGYRNLEVLPGRDDDLQTGYVRLKKDGMRLDLGGIAKGFAADQALGVLRKLGIKRAMVAASGDMAFGEPPPGESGWRIGIAPLSAESDKPSRYLRLAKCGVSTSGDAFQHVEIDGKRYSHIIDPRTGIGLTEQSSVTVVAPDATTADSLATAISVLGEVSAPPLLAKYAGAEMLFVRRDGEKILAMPSEGFEKHLDSKKPDLPAN